MAEHVSAWYHGGARIVGDKVKAVGVPIVTGLDEVKYMKLTPEEARVLSQELSTLAAEAAWDG